MSNKFDLIDWMLLESLLKVLKLRLKIQVRDKLQTTLEDKVCSITENLMYIQKFFYAKFDILISYRLDVVAWVYWSNK